MYYTERFFFPLKAINNLFHLVMGPNVFLANSDCKLKFRKGILIFISYR